MKKSLFLGMAAMAALVFTGCQKDVVLNEVPQDQPIAFGTYLGRDAATKGIVLDNSTLPGEGFGVFACYTGQKLWDSTSVLTKLNPNFMYNQEVTSSDGSTWTYTPKKYWPSTAGDKISFFAYAPYDEDPNTGVLQIIDASSPSVGCPSIKYTVSDDISEHVDLVFAPAQLNKEKNISPGGSVSTVDFNFYHALSRVDFKVQTSNTFESTTQVIITNLNFTAPFYKSAILNLETSKGTASTSGTPAVSTPKWSDFQPSPLVSDNFLLRSSTSDITTEDKIEELITNGLSVDGTLTSVLPKIGAKSNYLMILPQSFDANDIQVDIEYFIVTEDSNMPLGYSVIPHSHTYKNSSTFTFAAGKAYTYNIIISLDSIEFTANVENWDESDDEHKTDVNI